MRAIPVCFHVFLLLLHLGFNLSLLRVKIYYVPSRAEKKCYVPSDCQLTYQKSTSHSLLCIKMEWYNFVFYVIQNVDSYVAFFLLCTIRVSAIILSFFIWNYHSSSRLSKGHTLISQHSVNWSNRIPILGTWFIQQDIRK